MDPFVPNSAMSKDEYYQEWNKTHALTGAGRHTSSADSWLNKIFNPSQTAEFENAYKAYLTDIENSNNAGLEQWKMDYQKILDDTKYQRMVKDLEAAGLNPWLLLNNGGSAGQAPAVVGSSSSLDYSRNDGKKSSRSDMANLVGTAMKVLALLAIAG